MPMSGIMKYIIFHFKLPEDRIRYHLERSSSLKESISASSPYVQTPVMHLTSNFPALLRSAPEKEGVISGSEEDL